MRPHQPRKPGDLSPASQDNPRGKGGLNAKTRSHSGWPLRARWLCSVLTARVTAQRFRQRRPRRPARGRQGRQGADRRDAAGPRPPRSRPARKANCFGAGTGGSGKSVTVQGAPRSGLLGPGARSRPALRPLLDHRRLRLRPRRSAASARARSSGKASWYLKVNHKGATVSGDTVKLKAGDEVLWDLAPSYPYPDELVAGSAGSRRPPACRSRSASSPTTKRASASRSPGAAVTGRRSAPTGANGKATVTLTATDGGLHRRDSRQGHPLAGRAGLPRRRRCPAGS